MKPDMILLWKALTESDRITIHGRVYDPSVVTLSSGGHSKDKIVLTVKEVKNNFVEYVIHDSKYEGHGWFQISCDSDLDGLGVQLPLSCRVLAEWRQ